MRWTAVLPFKDLIPYIPLVEFDPVLPEELPVFVLERSCPVMLFLAVDVGGYRFKIFRAD